MPGNAKKCCIISQTVKLLEFGINIYRRKLISHLHTINCLIGQNTLLYYICRDIYSCLSRWIHADCSLARHMSVPVQFLCFCAKQCERVPDKERLRALSRSLFLYQCQPEPFVCVTSFLLNRSSKGWQTGCFKTSVPGGSCWTAATKKQKTCSALNVAEAALMDLLDRIVLFKSDDKLANMILVFVFITLFLSLVGLLDNYLS